MVIIVQMYLNIIIIIMKSKGEDMKKEKPRKEFTNEDAAYKYQRELEKKGYKTYFRSCYNVFSQEMTYAVGVERKRCDDTCENCIYICEGDFICDIKNELVISDWIPLNNFCLLEEDN